MENTNEVEEEVKILSGAKLLSAEELNEYRYVDVNTKIGQKKTISTGSLEEKAAVIKLLSDLKKRISVPRIERLANRSVAEWDVNTKRAIIKKIVGKFQNFGYTENKTHYLTKYETLFLLELNRLELYFNSVLVSIEQAYYLLFGAHKNKYYENYLVYSTLTRAGYIVKNFDNRSNNVCVTEEDCIWEILLSLNNPDYKIPLYVKDYDKFDSIKNSMIGIIGKIRNPSELHNQNADCSSSSEELIIFNRRLTSKRKSTKNYHDIRKLKRMRYETNRKSFLNDLISEPEYEKYREIFTKLELMVMNKDTDDSIDLDRMQNARDLDIVFDIYLPSDSSIKYNFPDLQAIVIGPSEKFPSHAELKKLSNKQKDSIPIIVISVGVSKQIQAFMYYFT